MLIKEGNINVINSILSHSRSKDWDEATNEWDLFDFYEDLNMASSCACCGQKGLRYLFEVKNKKTNEILFPVGSQCIKKFGREDLNERVSKIERNLKLLHAVRDNSFIDLSFFSRKILEELYKEGAFKPTPYNHNNGKLDYDFLLEMFNKRKKESITEKQKAKIRAIIVKSIIPFLKEKSRIKKLIEVEHEITLN